MTTLLRHRGLRFGSDDDRSMISAGTAGRSSVFFFFFFFFFLFELQKATARRQWRRREEDDGTARLRCVALRCSKRSKEAEMEGRKKKE